MLCSDDHRKQTSYALIFPRQALEKLLSGRIGRDLIAGLLQTPLDRGSERCIIIDNVNGTGQLNLPLNYLLV